MVSDDRLDDGEAEAGAARLRRVEGIEDPRQRLVGDASAGIAGRCSRRLVLGVLIWYI